MPGQFHEISIAAPDIRASVEFYESLGFTQAATGDTWPHPYGVLTDGRIFIGLHQLRFDSPVMTFVQPGIREQAPRLESLGVRADYLRVGDDVFNELGFTDPTGQRARLLEARTYSPVTRRKADVSLCGYFAQLSLPASDFAAASAFWESLGFVATEEVDEPYPHLPMTSDHLDIAFHRPRFLDAPALVFQDAAMSARIAALRERGVTMADSLPRGLDRDSSAVVEAPEGTLLLLVRGED